MKISRRESLYRMAAGSVLATMPFSISSHFLNPHKIMNEQDPGKIHHSACRWCYNDIPLEVLCVEGKKFGLESIDLIGPSEWPVVQQYGLTCAMGNGADLGIPKGWNHMANHQQLISNYRDIMPIARKAGIKNIILFSGNREGMDEETGLNNCVTGIKQVIGDAEKNKVVLTMELLNSKIDHKDYQCDHIGWGVELCKRIDSENFKLLFDIYHMQIMEGDIIRTIRENSGFIEHYHTGGVPGRHEIDNTQELFYPAIMRAILETGFTGFVAQEFVPTAKDKLASLKKCIEFCNV